MKEILKAIYELNRRDKARKRPKTFDYTKEKLCFEHSISISRVNRENNTIDIYGSGEDVMAGDFILLTNKGTVRYKLNWVDKTMDGDMIRWSGQATFAPKRKFQ